MMMLPIRAEAVTFDEQAGEPASECADDDPGQNGLGRAWGAVPRIERCLSNVAPEQCGTGASVPPGWCAARQLWTLSKIQKRSGKIETSGGDP